MPPHAECDLTCSRLVIYVFMWTERVQKVAAYCGLSCGDVLGLPPCSGIILSEVSSAFETVHLVIAGSFFLTTLHFVPGCPFPIVNASFVACDKANSSDTHAGPRSSAMAWVQKYEDPATRRSMRIHVSNPSFFTGMHKCICKTTWTV